MLTAFRIFRIILWSFVRPLIRATIKNINKAVTGLFGFSLLCFLFVLQPADPALRPRKKLYFKARFPKLIPKKRFYR